MYNFLLFLNFINKKQKNFLLITVFFLFFLSVYSQKITNYNATGIEQHQSLTSIAVDTRSNTLWIGTTDLYLKTLYKDQWNENWSTPSNYIYDIAIDSIGNKWIATRAGVSMYNDTTWTHYYPSNGLISNYVSCIHVDKLNNKWFGTYCGISKFNDSTWTNYNTTYKITSITSDHENNIWYSDNGVTLIKGDSTYHFSDTNGLKSNNVYALYCDYDGNIWVGTECGISIYKNKKWEQISYPNDKINVICQGNDSSMYFGCDGKIIIYKNGKIDYHYVVNFALIKDISKDSKGNLWFATYINGIIKYDGRTWTTYTYLNKLTSNEISAIQIDKDNNKWFATWSGISILDSIFWNNIQKTSSPNSGLAIDQNNNKWTSSYLNGLLKIDNSILTFYKAPNGLVSNTIYDISVDMLNDKWISTNKGVSRFNDKNWITYNSLNTFIPLNNITCSTVDQNNIKWFGIFNGVDSYNNGIASFDNISWKFYLKNEWFHCLAVDKKNQLWMGTNNGILLFDGNKWEVFKHKDGLLSDTVSSITIDANNKKWIGTTQGVSIYNDTNWISFTKNEGLVNNSIRAIAIDYKGIKWIGTSYGLTKYEDGGPRPLEFKKIQRGIVFEDVNSNGIKDSNDIIISNQIIQVDSNYISTQDKGMFFSFVSNGKHIFKYKADKYKRLTTDSVLTVNINDTLKLDTLYFGVKSLKNFNDVSVNISGTVARAGFKSGYWIDYTNHGTVNQNGSIVLNIDTLISIIYTIPTPDSIYKNRYFWNITSLAPQQNKQIYYYTQMPSVKSLGKTLISSVAFNINNLDTNISNNSDTIKQLVTGSFDPNDKLVKEGVLSNNYVLFNKPLTFTIRFQNTGTDLAFNINIRDTLNSNLDVSTLKILASSHPVSLELRGTNEVTFVFNNILLPDSNLNEPASHGFIKFNISPKANLAENTIVNNKAYIFFDFNPAIITNETKNTFVSVIPDTITNIDNKAIEKNNIFTIYPNPTKQNVTLTFNSSYKVNSIEIVNTIGQTVFTKQFKTTRNSEQLDLFNLQKGIYFIKVQTDIGNFIKKIVKD